MAMLEPTAINLSHQMKESRVPVRSDEALRAAALKLEQEHALLMKGELDGAFHGRNRKAATRRGLAKDLRA